MYSAGPHFGQVAVLSDRWGHAGADYLHDLDADECSRISVPACGGASPLECVRQSAFASDLHPGARAGTQCAFLAGLVGAVLCFDGSTRRTATGHQPAGIGRGSGAGSRYCCPAGAG
uniref:Uncharacterized protein n=1 Tax=Panagrolaimus superbus TaxID=310955 RepID=A0A914YAE5_9BILA